MECLLAHMTRVLAPTAAGAIVVSNEHSARIEAFVLQLTDALCGELQIVEIDAYATHVLKTLIKVLAGKRLNFVKSSTSYSNRVCIFFAV